MAGRFSVANDSRVARARRSGLLLSVYALCAALVAPAAAQRAHEAKSSQTSSASAKRHDVSAARRRFGTPEWPGFVRFRGRTARLGVQMVDGHGKVRLSGLRALATVMRRHEGDPRPSVHPRLALLLSKISDHFGGREIHVVSGFRQARGYTRETSRHTCGRAADIRVEGVPRRAVWNYCRSLAQTGCGFYPSSVFVHVDVRARAAQWVDWSAPGRSPRYGTLRRAYGRGERTRPDRQRVTRRVTRPHELPLIVEVIDEDRRVLRVADERATDAQPAQTERQRAESGTVLGASATSTM